MYFVRMYSSSAVQLWSVNSQWIDIGASQTRYHNGYLFPCMFEGGHVVSDLGTWDF